MAVNLSPVGGVAAQFFDNSGYPLTGGKLYSYAAGTTTPLATYTSSNGSTAHTNPIVLDASGRVPNGGEIWLTDGLQYKFVLKTSDDVLIATYDNITGINSNFVNYTNQQEIQTATAGQTVFTLTTMQYQPGTGSLSVFVDGVNQYGPGAQYSFQETDSTTVTFNAGLHVGASVKFTTTAINAASYGDAFQISYTPPFTGSVATNVGDKLAQYVSVKDFGAVGDGITNDTLAIQNAINAVPLGGTLYIPSGNYLFSTLSVLKNITIIGDGWTGTSGAGFGQSYWSTVVKGTVLRSTATSGVAISVSVGSSNTYPGPINFKNFALIGPGTGTSIGLQAGNVGLPPKECLWEELLVANFSTGVYIININPSSFVNLNIGGCNVGLNIVGDVSTCLWFYGLTVEATNQYAVQFSGGTTPTGIHFVDFLVQSNYGTVLQLDGANYCTFRNGWFENPSATGKEIYLRGGNCKFENCNGIRNAIQIVAGSENNIFRDFYAQPSGVTLTVPSNSFGNIFDNVQNITISNGATAQVQNATWLRNRTRNTNLANTGVATTETNLQFLYLSTVQFNNQSSIDISAAGNVIGTSNTKTIRLYLGTSKIGELNLPASAEGSWLIRASVIFVDLLNQKVITEATFWDGGATSTYTVNYYTPAVDFTASASVDVKTTGTTPNAGDEIYSQMIFANIY